MSNNVLKEILEVTGARAKKSAEDEQDFYERLVDSIYALEDDEWKDLSKPSQSWYNEAARAVNNQVDIPSPDGDSDDEDDDDDDKPKRGRGGRKGSGTPARRSRSANKDEEDDDDKPKRSGRSRKEKPKDTTAKDLKVGQEVSIEDKDGDEYVGIVKKMLARKFVLEDDQEGELEFTYGRIASVEIINDVEDEEDDDDKPKRGRGRGRSKPADKSKRGRRSVSKDEEDDNEDDDDLDNDDEVETLDFEDLEEDMTVRIVTEDDEIEGTVVGVKSRSVSIKPFDGSAADRISKSEIDIITVIEEEEKPKRGRGRPAKSDKGSRTSRASSRRGGSKKDSKPGGRGAGPSIRSEVFAMLAKNPKLTSEKVRDRLEEKRGEEVKPQTVNQICSAFQEAYAALDEAGLIAD